MRIALDTNVLAYAEGVNGPARRDTTVSLLAQLRAELVVPAQVLAELLRLLVGKAGLSASDAGARILTWVDAAETPPTTAAAVLEAASLVQQHQLNPFDALILCVAAEADCRLLLSEDLHDGFTWRGISVVNPYAMPHSPLLESVLVDPAP